MFRSGPGTVRSHPFLLLAGLASGDGGVTGCADSEWVNRINQWFDGLPGPAVWITGREVPTFRVTGAAGLLGGMITLTCGLLGRGLSPMIGAGVAAISVAGFFGWALLRRLVTGRESLVLLEHVWVTMALVTAYLFTLGQPIANWLDLLAVGLTVFLAVGRVGCLLAGCCYGYPSSVGRLSPQGVSPHWQPIRLFPVPLVEAVALAVLALAGFVGLAFVPAGGVALGLGVTYALVRLGTECLRGDRPHSRLRLSAARWMALLQLVAVLVLADWWYDGRIAPAPLLAPAAVAAVSVVVLLRGRSEPALTLDLIRRLRAAVDLAGPQPVSTEIGRGVVATTTRTRTGLDLGIDGMSGPATARLARLCGAVTIRADRGTAQVTLEPEPAAEPAVEDTPPVLNGAPVNGSRLSYFTAS